MRVASGGLPASPGESRRGDSETDAAHMKLWLAPEAPLVDSRRRNLPTVKAS
jgi:hypothetical protein